MPPNVRPIPQGAVGWGRVQYQDRERRVRSQKQLAYTAFNTLNINIDSLNLSWPVSSSLPCDDQPVVGVGTEFIPCHAHTGSQVMWHIPRWWHHNTWEPMRAQQCIKTELAHPSTKLPSSTSNQHGACITMTTLTQKQHKWTQQMDKTSTNNPAQLSQHDNHWIENSGH